MCQKKPPKLELDEYDLSGVGVCVQICDGGGGPDSLSWSSM